MPGVRFGHAATIVEGKKGSARSKMETLLSAGIKVANHFSEIVFLVRGSL